MAFGTDESVLFIVTLGGCWLSILSLISSRAVICTVYRAFPMYDLLIIPYDSGIIHGIIARGQIVK